MKKVNILSSSYKYKGQGVASAFDNHIHLMKALKDDFEVFVNSKEHLEESDIIHVHTLDLGHYFALRKMKKGALLVVSAHIVPDSLKGSLKLTALWLPIFTKYLLHFYRYCDVIIAVSDQVKEELIDLGLPEEKIVIFTNYIIRDHFETHYSADEKKALREKYNIPQDHIIVISAGQIQPRKGIQEFVETAQKLKDEKTTFIWCGNMPFKHASEGYANMKALINNAPDNVLFPGLVDENQMKEYYGLSDAFFLPSRQETFGLVIPEAGGSSLPIVLRDIPVYKNIFGDHYLKGKDVDDFASWIKQLKDDPALYAEYAKKAFDLFEQYTEDKYTEKIKNLYLKAYEKKFQQ